MIQESIPLSLAEVKDLVKKLKVENKDLDSLIKKFGKVKDHKGMRKEIEELKLLKVKPEHVVKIIDTLPEDVSELNKLFAEATLDENEATKVLEIVKKHK